MYYTCKLNTTTNDEHKSDDKVNSLMHRSRGCKQLPSGLTQTEGTNFSKLLDILHQEAPQPIHLLNSIVKIINVYKNMDHG